MPANLISFLQMPAPDAIERIVHADGAASCTTTRVSHQMLAVISSVGLI